jgi:hypothetical protein
MSQDYRLKGGNLCRVGADDACIWCGLPDLPGLLCSAHIDERDLHLSPDWRPQAGLPPLLVPPP